MISEVAAGISPDGQATEDSWREVELEAVVAEDGTVEKVNVVKRQSRTDRPGRGGERWKFKPFMADGKAVPGDGAGLLLISSVVLEIRRKK